MSGHSHRPRVEEVGGVLYVNPGSAGPRRFRLPIALARLDVVDGTLRASIHDLAPRAGVPLERTPAEGISDPPGPGT